MKRALLVVAVALLLAMSLQSIIYAGDIEEVSCSWTGDWIIVTKCGCNWCIYPEAPHLQVKDYWMIMECSDGSTQYQYSHSTSTCVQLCGSCITP